MAAYRSFVSALSISLVVGTSAGAASLSLIGTNTTGIFSTAGGASEIPAYDPATKRIFVVNAVDNRVDILDASGLTTGSFGSIPKIGEITGLPGSPNSVAIANGVVAVAVQDATKTNNGTVRFYDTAGTLLNSVAVGALPDMLTFTPDGSKLLVANEGEPDFYGAGNVDPQGTVSVIDLSGGVGGASVATADFTSYVGQEAALRAQGVRIFGPGANAAMDFEPESIAVSPDGTKAWVTLQENNAIAEISLVGAPAVTTLRPLGLKDHSLAGNGLDASDGGGSGGGGPLINITTAPVKGMYMPDGIASFTAGGQTFYVTANEGDARDYTGLVEEVRVGAGAYALDAGVFPNAATLKQNANLGRLTVSNQTGNTDADAQFEEIHVFGARSFTIWDENGQIVFESGDDLEQITAAALATSFNSSHDNNASFDTRSDNKGPEPEGVAVGVVNGRTYAFIGLERIGGIVVYDVTDPNAPSFVQYLNNRDFTQPANSAGAGDLGPEGLVFVSAANSFLGVPLLIVGNEISGTTSVYSFAPEPGTLALLALGVGFAAWRRRQPAAGRCKGDLQRVQ